MILNSIAKDKMLRSSLDAFILRKFAINQLNADWIDTSK